MPAFLLLAFLSAPAADASCHDRDEDRDGINSCDDRCPNTPPGTAVDALGCPCGQLDDDSDGVTNCDDRCPGLDDRLDSDGDQVADCLDACGGTGAGAEVAGDGCPPVFVNWESPQTHPLELTPDGTLLLAANTADNRLEVFDVRTPYARSVASVPVGLEPVSVRARTGTELWVVNRISDSISVVDLTTRNVIATLRTGDEPADVVFAGSPQRAFVSIAGLDRLEVYDPSDLSIPAVKVPIQGKSPRALATDGRKVHVAIFESGNGTTIIPHEEVSAAGGPYGGLNPPPNLGTEFSLGMHPENPRPPPTGLIVRRDAAGRWLDDNGRDWSSKVSWNVIDHDLASVDADTLEVRHAGGFMNLCMALAVRPDGKVAMVGTDGINEVRFEPNLKGVFLRVKIALIDPDAPAPAAALDLNPHLDYSRAAIAESLRAESIGDPRGVVWDGAGARGFVSGMGSNNVAVIDSSGRRLGRIEVGKGPTGLVLDPRGARLYVLNRFEGTVSVVDLSNLVEVHRIRYFDPTPPEVRRGRPHFYGTREHSGLGQASCASCHVDGGLDHLAWDIGNPVLQVKPFNQPCSGDIHPCRDWHPMKGPMLTQTLVGTVRLTPLHWRGDRESLAAFNPAFQTLLGGPSRLPARELAELRDFLESIRPAPNPLRRLDGSLGTEHPNGGNPRIGEELFNSPEIRCVSCHSLPEGTKPGVAAAGLLRMPQGMNIPHLLNLQQRTGFDKTALSSARGFGFLHDGSADTIFDLLLQGGIDHSNRPAVQFAGEEGREAARHLEAFVLSLPAAIHPAMGLQVTVSGPEGPAAADQHLIEEMVRLAESRSAGLIVKGRRNGQPRGYVYAGGGRFQSDRAGEAIDFADLAGGAGPGSEVTFTVVPHGARIRMGIDRDLDGMLDRDELDSCVSPFEVSSAASSGSEVGCDRQPEFLSFRRGDANGSGDVDISDAVAVLEALFLGGAIDCADAGDANDDGAGDISDPVYLLEYLFLGGLGPPAPYVACGPDFTPDGLRCDRYPACVAPLQPFTAGSGIQLVRIPRGSFRMGSAAGEKDRDLDEAPFRAAISRDYFIGVTEVTHFKYRKVMGQDRDPAGDCPSCPVTGVAWSDAVEFCRVLTLADRARGLIGPADVYRLPTEAEWEYACRAGTSARFSFGEAGSCGRRSCKEPCAEIEPYAWWCGNSGGRPQPVAQKLPNPWGLFDMHGNALEWCQDWYGLYPEGEVLDPQGPPISSYRTLRGGSYLDAAPSQRSAARHRRGPGDSLTGAGFRVVLEKS